MNKYVTHPSEKNIEAKPILIKLSTGEEIVAVVDINDIIKGDDVVGGKIGGIQETKDAKGFVELKMPVVAIQENEEHQKSGKIITVVKYILKPWFEMSSGMYTNIHYSYILGYSEPNKSIEERYNDLLARVQLWHTDPDHACDLYGVKEFNSLEDAEEFLDGYTDISEDEDDDEYDFEWDMD